MANDKTFPEVKTNPLTEAAKKRLSRSMMFVPGNTPKMINSADIHGSDSIMIDIEDSVPITEKDTARLLTAEALKSRKFRAETVVRINHPTQTPYGYDDLDVIVPAKPDMIRLPKTEDVSEVEIVAKKIEEVEKANGWPEGTINIIVDYRADLRTGKHKPAVELLFARQTILHAAREAGIRVIDTVFSDVKDPQGFREEVEFIKALGYDGKSCIHPSQIKIIHEVFTPDEKEIAHSVKVLNSYADALRNNKGVISVDGKMIDGPIVVRAQRVVDKARAAGIKVELEEGAEYDVK